MINLDGQSSGEQKEQTHRLTSAVCHSFFELHKDLEKGMLWMVPADIYHKPSPTNCLFVTEELVVLVKTLEKVNEEPPNKPLEGNLSIHSSIHLSIRPSFHPSIHFPICGAGALIGNDEEKHLKALIESVKSKCSS